MENENCEHIIKLDSYVEVRLNLPKVMDCVTFFAIVTKAKKMFNLSEQDTGILNFSPKQNISKNYIPKGRKTPFTDEICLMILEEGKKEPFVRNWIKITEEINRKFNTQFTRKQVNAKFGNIQTHNPLRFREQLKQIKH